MYFNRPGGNQDGELLDEVAKGNASAFNLLYKQYAAKVYAMSLGYLKSPFLAQDAVQEVFVRVWKNRQQLPGLKSFPAWLHTLTKNQLITALRQEIPMESLENLEESGKSIVHPAVDEDTDHRELERLIRSGLNNCSPRQQEIYLMSRDEGLSHKEIAEKLNISYDMVREHMSKALKSLRHFLETNYGYLVFILLFSRNK